MFLLNLRAFTNAHENGGKPVFSKGTPGPKAAGGHANVHNHVNSERHFVDQQTYQALHSVALAEWRSLAA